MMFATDDEKDIYPLIDKELDLSKINHEERFSDEQEARYILCKELKEAEAEIDMIEYYLKKNDINGVFAYAVNCIKELIQVAAMCRKWKESGV